MTAGLLSRRCLAAPSWVKPGSAAENVVFLAGFPQEVQEVALCFFETKAATPSLIRELGAAISHLPLRRHVHLPADLPWRDVDEVNRALLGIMDAIAPGGHISAVLHPPLEGDISGLLASVSRAWAAGGRFASDILLENIAGVDLAALLPDMEEHGFSVCLDVGHALAFRQEGLLDVPGLMERVRLLHLHAPGSMPGRPDAHRPLSELRPRQECVVAKALLRAPQDATLVIEVFDWQGYRESLPVLARLLSRAC